MQIGSWIWHVHGLRKLLLKIEHSGFAFNLTTWLTLSSQRQIWSTIISFNQVRLSNLLFVVIHVHKLKNLMHLLGWLFVEQNESLEEGQEYAVMLYTWRCCSRALPQVSHFMRMATCFWRSFNLFYTLPQSYKFSCFRPIFENLDIRVMLLYRSSPMSSQTEWRFTRKQLKCSVLKFRN